MRASTSKDSQLRGRRKTSIVALTALLALAAAVQVLAPTTVGAAASQQDTNPCVFFPDIGGSIDIRTGLGCGSNPAKIDIATPTGKTPICVNPRLCSVSSILGGGRLQVVSDPGGPTRETPKAKPIQPKSGLKSILAQARHEAQCRAIRAKLNSDKYRVTYESLTQSDTVSELGGNPFLDPRLVSEVRAMMRELRGCPKAEESQKRQ